MLRHIAEGGGQVREQYDQGACFAVLPLPPQRGFCLVSSAFADSSFQMLFISEGRSVASVHSCEGDSKRIIPGLRGSQADGEFRIGRARGKWKLANTEP